MLAVIIPVRNTPDWQLSLRSLLTGERVPEQCIIVDDGSEPSLVLAGDIASVCECRLVKIAPSGPAAARNYGVSQTDADILVFLDADVTVSPTTIRDLEERLRGAPDDVAAIQTIYSSGPEEAGFGTVFQNLLQRYNFLQCRDPEHFAGLSSYCIAVRRAAFIAAGGFDEAVGRATVEDDTFGLKLIRDGWRIQLALDIEVTHRAEYRVTTLARRMFRMAVDKVRTVRRHPWTGRAPVSNSHHRPAFLASAALAVLTGLLGAWAPLWSLLVFVALFSCHLPFLLYSIRENGLMFGVRSAAMMLVLSYAAALGSLVGLWG
jgi:GT2 family glycosyltransferase